MILTADIGATKTLIALYEKRDQKWQAVQQLRFRSRDFNDVTSLLNAFIKQLSRPVKLQAACLGVPGSVVKGRCETPNLGWTVTVGDIQTALDCQTVFLLNDLEALAWSIEALPPESLHTLNADIAGRSNIALIAAGTGLGEAILYSDGTHLHPIATEGGNADFAPQNEEQIDLLRYLQKQFEHVSYERVLSGPGLYRLYQFLQGKQPTRPSLDLQAQLEQGEASRVIVDAALKHQDRLCMKALEMFISIYGAEAGNMALRCLSHGGIYISGSIARAVLTQTDAEIFMSAFTHKGRYSNLVAGFPVHVIMDETAPLLGSVRYAQKQLSGL